MVNSILDGICLALHTAFPDYKIYTELVEQGFDEPCFYVKCLNPNINRYRGRLIDVKLNFVIQFFTESKELMNTVMPNIFLALETITADEDLVRGSNFASTTADEVMTITADFNYHALQPVSNTDMGTLEINQEVGE